MSGTGAYWGEDLHFVTIKTKKENILFWGLWSTFHTKNVGFGWLCCSIPCPKLFTRVRPNWVMMDWDAEPHQGWILSMSCLAFPGIVHLMPRSLCAIDQRERGKVVVEFWGVTGSSCRGAECMKEQLWSSKMEMEENPASPKNTRHQGMACKQLKNKTG